MARRGVNTVILIGNLGNDPETRFMPSGGAVTNLSVATSETWKDKQTGAPQERTEWHRVVLFNRLAEIAAEYLKKGAKVYIMGSLRTRKWQDNNGQDRYTTEIVASEMQMLDSRSGMGAAMSDAMDGASGMMPSPSSDRPVAAQPSTTHANPAKSSPAPVMSGGQFDDAFDDDIPF